MNTVWQKQYISAVNNKIHINYSIFVTELRNHNNIDGSRFGYNLTSLFLSVL